MMTSTRFIRKLVMAVLPNAREKTEVDRLSSFFHWEQLNLFDMKANRLGFPLLLLLSAAVFQLPAQQTETDRRKVEEVKAKAEAGDADSELWLGAFYDRGVGVP